MRNREIQQQCLSAFQVVVVATASTKCVHVCVISSDVITEAVTFFRRVPSCYCCLVNPALHQNPGWLRSGASSVMGLLNGLGPVTPSCLPNLLWNEISFNIFFSFFFPKFFSRALCKSKWFALFAREDALPGQALQEASGCARNMAQRSTGLTERWGVGAAPTPKGCQCLSASHFAAAGDLKQQKWEQASAHIKKRERVNFHQWDLLWGVLQTHAEVGLWCGKLKGRHSQKVEWR